MSLSESQGISCPKSMYTVVSTVFLDETLENLSGDKLGDLGENILAFVHNQRG